MGRYVYREVMSLEYILVNQSKKEMISFTHLNGAKPRELAGNSAQSAIVTWYLLTNQGDQIQLVSDSEDDWPFFSGSKQEAWLYPDKTDEIIDALISQGVLSDFGNLYTDKDEPDTVFIRDIKSAWQK
jgi:hypothetical protein